jgi:hypothetical protein
LKKTNRSKSAPARAQERQKSKPNPLQNFEPAWLRTEPYLKIGFALLAALISLLVYSSTVSSNGFASFPVDDSWIHLTFARTLATTGRFAYGVLNRATSGSTSPLFTFLEALFYIFIKDEFAVAVIPLVLAYCAAAWLFFSLIWKYTNEPWLSVTGTLVFLAMPSLAVLPSWGMETALVVALLLWALLAYREGHWISVGLALGAAIWARPDTVVFDIALGIDFIVTRGLFPSKPTSKAILTFAVLAGAYLTFNFALSGTPLPNTFYAKLAYYGGSTANFWPPLWSLVAGNGRMIAFILSIAGAIGMLMEKKRGNFILLLYPIGMIALYRWKLPLLFQNGRYLIPILPFVLLLSAIGAKQLARWLTKNQSLAFSLTTLFLMAALIGELTGFGSEVGTLTVEDAYIHRLQVTTAEWCGENLPANAIITTHDIGAFGYYSGRRIVDLVGLADPAMIPYLHKPGAVQELRKRGVTYAALLDNWYEIPNENTVFVDAPPESEIMRVYNFTDSTRFTTSKVLPIHRYLYQVIGGEADPSSFEDAMRESLMYEPNNALTYILGGEVLMKTGRQAAADSMLLKALTLFPNSTRARRDLAGIASRQR